MAGRSELAEFLRARRERLSPREVGLPVGRRRTPGLRREEVATLAGVSIDYLVRLEQGRDTNPSPAVLAALGDALRLTPEERHHLGKLVAMTNHAEFCPVAGPLLGEVRPSVRAMLDRLAPAPALVVGAANDVLAYNVAWASLAGPLGLLEGDPVPNLARHVFLHPRARDVWGDWDIVADEQAAQLRAAQACWNDDAHLRALLDELATAPEFVTRWETHAIDARRNGRLRVVHPHVGELRLVYEMLDVRDDDQRVVTWLAADDATDALLYRLLDVPAPVSPARLRVVGPA